MKKLHWLNLAEYASVVGLGIGAVASIVFRQMLYTSAPLSFLVLLNLANRRRFEHMTEKNTAIALSELDQKVAKHVELLNQQINHLPTPETVGNVRKSLLRKDREGLEKIAVEIKKIRQEMHQRITTLEQQNLSLAHDDVAKLQEQYSNLSEALSTVTAHLHRLSSATGADGLETQVIQLRNEVGQLQASLQMLGEQTKPTLTSLQDQINHFNRQFQKLPPPFDSSALRNEVGELIKMVTDAVPKRDWNVMVAEIQALHRQQESQAHLEESLRQEIQKLSQRIQTPAAPPDISNLREQMRLLEQQFQKLPPPFDATALSQKVEALMKLAKESVPKKDWSALIAQLKALHRQQEEQAEVTQELRQELQAVNRQLRELPGSAQVRTQVEELLRYQLRELNDHLQQQLRAAQDRTHPIALPAARKNGNHLIQLSIDSPSEEGIESQNGIATEIPIRTQEEFQARIEEMLHRELLDINQQLQALPDTPAYEFVFDVVPPHLKSGKTWAEAIANSRAILMEALEQTQERLILIWPWSSQCDLDEALLAKFRSCLDQNRQIDLGWCHLANPSDERFLTSINQRWSINPLDRGSLQETLQKFLQLKRDYPEQFRFKILGAIENFLVSDQTFAVLGIDSVLVTESVLPDLELKLRTRDPDVIQRLIHRFDIVDLEAGDLEAFWNRAVTRHDLGDKVGAKADFDHILAAMPNDAAALNYRGTVRFDQKDFAGALADFNQSIELNSQQVAAYCNRGFLQAESGQLQAAIADYSLAIWACPHSAVAYFYRGMAYQKLGNLQGALTDYSEAIRFALDSAVAHYHRGIVAQKIGDLSTAITDFEAASRLFAERGSHTNAQKALNSLNKLRQAG